MLQEQNIEKVEETPNIYSFFFNSFFLMEYKKTQMEFLKFTHVDNIVWE